MTLQELLDELRENLLRDTSNIVSGGQDNLWSDESLIRYLNDAHRRFARRALCIRDMQSPECTQITLEEGVSNYPLHKSVISVMSARYNTDTYDLKRTGHDRLFSTFPVETAIFDVNLAGTATPGRPVAYSTDEGQDPSQNSASVLKVFPDPSAAEVGNLIYLRVVRAPLSSWSINDDLENTEPEIDEDYHLDLVEWAAFRALRTLDVDGSDYTKAATFHRARFDEAVAEARQDTRRRYFAPLSYSFGQNAFSWES